ncbi:hypothetical protein GCM10010837_20980 [Aminobacter niigataensis]
MSAFIRASAAAAVGLADSRSKRAHQLAKRLSSTRPGAKLASVAPVPHVVAAASMKASSRSRPITHLSNCA